LRLVLLRRQALARRPTGPKSKHLQSRLSPPASGLPLQRRGPFARGIRPARRRPKLAPRAKAGQVSNKLACSPCWAGRRERQLRPSCASPIGSSTRCAASSLGWCARSLAWSGGAGSSVARQRNASPFRRERVLGGEQRRRVGPEQDAPRAPADGIPGVERRARPVPVDGIPGVERRARPVPAGGIPEAQPRARPVPADGIPEAEQRARPRAGADGTALPVVNVGDRRRPAQVQAEPRRIFQAQAAAAARACWAEADPTAICSRVARAEALRSMCSGAQRPACAPRMGATRRRAQALQPAARRPRAELARKLLARSLFARKRRSRPADS